MLEGQVAENEQGCKELSPLEQRLRQCQKVLKIGPAARVAENSEVAESLFFQGQLEYTFMYGVLTLSPTEK